MDSPMTFCVGCCNNLNYLKLAVHSVRKYSHFKDAPFIIFAENCTDGTDEWLVKCCDKLNNKYNLQTIIQHNDEEHTQGIGGGMNVCASHTNTEYIMFLHADMFVSQDWDIEALKASQKYPEPSWISSMRFQPNIFNEHSRPGTLVFPLNEFGYKHDDFNEEYFIEYVNEFHKLNNEAFGCTKGEGVSGLIKKADWDYIGGNDPIFAPAYWEDTDLWMRMQLANYTFEMTPNSIVFHFGSRSDKSNFPTDEIVRSEKSKIYERRGAERFFQKWGFWPVHNEYQFNVLPPNIDRSKLQHLIRLQQ